MGKASFFPRYTLSFPNEEVKYGFLESLMPSYVPRATAGNGLDIFTLDEAVENGKLSDWAVAE